MRENRTGKAPLIEPKELKNEYRGQTDAIYDHNDKIAAVRWNDNAVSIHIYFKLAIDNKRSRCCHGQRMEAALRHPQLPAQDRNY